jgi:hypothetical protein
MAGLVPAIYVLDVQQNKTWMPGIKPGMTQVDCISIKAALA